MIKAYRVLTLLFLDTWKHNLIFHSLLKVKFNCFYRGKVWQFNIQELILIKGRKKNGLVEKQVYIYQMRYSYWNLAIIVVPVLKKVKQSPGLWL